MQNAAGAGNALAQLQHLLLTQHGAHSLLLHTQVSTALPRPRPRSQHPQQSSRPRCMLQVQQAVAQAAAQQLQQLQARAGAVPPPTTGTSPTYKYMQGSFASFASVHLPSTTRSSNISVDLMYIAVNVNIVRLMA